MTSLFERLAAEGYFSDLDVHFARTMCDITGETDPLVLLGAAVSSRFVASGHVCAPIEELNGLRVSVPGDTINVRWPGGKEWKAALTASTLVGSGNPATPLVLENGNLYLFKYWKYESNLAINLARRAKLSMKDIDEKSLDESLNRQLGAEQSELRRILKTAATSGLTVISGGPGTGKTSAVVAILATLFEQAERGGRESPRAILLAPTGKAAARLTDSIRKAGKKNGFPVEASTIHRALGVRKKRPASFTHNENNPLASNVVVVDEASMVDIALMAKLEAAVPKQARLILIGDKNQLASVEAGAVLGEINIPNRVIHLTKSYRFDKSSGIGNLARGINTGAAEDVVKSLDSGDFDDIRLVDLKEMNESSMTEFLAPYVTSHYVPYFFEKDPLKRLIKFESFRVLAAHREGISGVSGINRMIESILRKEGLIEDSNEWYDGRPVIVTRNDYENGLFNGDVAMTCKKENEPGLRAHFPSGPGNLEGISLGRLPRTETAFALTVHKAQGSEFEDLLVVLPPTWSPVMTRQLLYTAVTRSRKRVTILASREVLKKTILTPTSRAIGLGDRLEELMQ